MVSFDGEVIGDSKNQIVLDYFCISIIQIF